jgi:hypothetical protein
MRFGAGVELLVEMLAHQVHAEDRHGSSKPWEPARQSLKLNTAGGGGGGGGGAPVGGGGFGRHPGGLPRAHM